MPIIRVSSPEGRLLQEPDQIEAFLTRLDLDDSLDLLDPGAYDLTPESWKNVFHTILHVHDDDTAILLGTQIDTAVEMEDFATLIPEQENITMMMTHDKDGVSTRLYETVFYLSPEELL